MRHKAEVIEITEQMAENWRRLRFYGHTVREIADDYAVSPYTVSLYTKKERVSTPNYIDEDTIKPISEEEFRKRDIVPNRNVRGLSGKAMARLLALDREE